MVTFAVTGGIACGKSLTGLLLAEAGVAVCDTDQLAHQLMSRGRPVYDAVVQTFGRVILGPDKAIDRTRLGSLVFDDSRALAKLNALVHPAVKESWRDWLAGQSGVKAAAVLIPLLYEVGEEAGWDAVVCVACSPDIQFKRLMERGFSERETRLRMNAQMPIEEKMERADYVIFNEGSVEVLREQTQRVLNDMVEK